MAVRQRARTVRARMHAGADSLDLTIPADVCRALDLKPGDVWAVSVSDGPRPVLTYTRLVKP